MHSKKHKTSKQRVIEHGWNYVGREWGIYLNRNIEYPKAERYFIKSLQMDPKQTRTLLESSRCKLLQCEPKNALDDIKKCMEIDPNNVKSRHQHSKCLFDLNEMEAAFFVAHSIAAEKPTNMDVRHTKNAVEISLQNAFRPSAQTVLGKYKMHINDTANESNEPKTNTKTPIIEQREKAIELMKHKLYFDSTFAEQLDFWQCVQLDKTLDDDMQKTIERIINNLKTHENMLYAREPIYAKRYRFDRNSLVKSKHRAFYYAQDETRREALWQIKRIKELTTTNFMAALALVERVLSEFYAVRRRAIFPAKYEFISEICHFVSSQYLKIYQKIPCDLMSLPIKERLVAMFTVYGSIQQDEDLCDIKVGNLRKHLDSTNYDIEKVYICHQLSEICIRFRRPEESQRYARDVVNYANQCDSNIWKFLGYYNIIRIDAMKQNFLTIKDDLSEMQAIAANLNTFSKVFVDTAFRSLEDIRNMRN